MPSAAWSRVRPAPSRPCRNDGESGQAHDRPARHDRQTPHGTIQDRATSLPTPEPGRHGVDLRADGLDDPGPFVTHDDRPGPVPLRVADVQVGVAHPAGEHPDADLARARFVELEPVDRDQGDPAERAPQRDPCAGRSPRPGRARHPEPFHDRDRPAVPRADVHDKISPERRVLEADRIARPEPASVA